MAATLTMPSTSSPGLNVPRIKRKPPPIIDVSERYPSPDPLDPFAPLWALRTRTQSIRNGSTTSILPYANPYGSQETLELSNGPGTIHRQRPNPCAFESSTTTGDVSTLIDGNTSSPISSSITPSPTAKKILPKANPIANSNVKFGHYRPHSQINTVGNLQSYPRIEPHASYILTVDPIQNADTASPLLDPSVVSSHDVDSIHSPPGAPLEGALAGSSDSGSESDSVSTASFKFKRQETLNSVSEHHQPQSPTPPKANGADAPSRGTHVNVKPITNPADKPQQKREGEKAPSSQSRFARFLSKKHATAIGARTDEVGHSTQANAVQSDATPQTRSMGTISVLEKKTGFPKTGNASISAPQALMPTADWESKNSTSVRGAPSPVNEYATSAILVSAKGISLVPQVSNRDLEMESREGGDDISRRLSADSHAIRKKLETGDARAPKRHFGEGYTTGAEATENKPGQGSNQRSRAFTSSQKNGDRKPNTQNTVWKRRSLPIRSLRPPSPILPSSHSISNTSIVNISMPIPATAFLHHTSEGAYSTPRSAPRPPLAPSHQGPRAKAKKKDNCAGHCEPGPSFHPQNKNPKNPSSLTEYELPTAAQMIQAAALPLTCEDGSKIPFGSLFTAHRTIVVFIRHFLCPNCQDYMSSIKELVKPEMLSRWSDDASEQRHLVSLVVISNGAHALIRKYRKIFGLPFLVYTDPDMGVYKALGMGKAGHVHHPVHHPDRVPPPSKSPGKGTAKRGSYVKHNLLSGIAMVIVRSIKVGMAPWDDGGDVAQLGGEFVFGPGSTCLFAHRMQSPKDHVPIEEVLTAAGISVADLPASGGDHSNNVDRASTVVPSALPSLEAGERRRRHESMPDVQAVRTRHSHRNASVSDIIEKGYWGGSIMMSRDEEDEWMAERQRKIELLHERKKARRGGRSLIGVSIAPNETARVEAGDGPKDDV